MSNKSDDDHRFMGVCHHSSVEAISWGVVLLLMAGYVLLKETIFDHAFSFLKIYQLVWVSLAIATTVTMFIGIQQKKSAYILPSLIFIFFCFFISVWFSPYCLFAGIFSITQFADNIRNKIASPKAVQNINKYDQSMLWPYIWSCIYYILYFFSNTLLISTTFKTYYFVREIEKEDRSIEIIEL